MLNETVKKQLIRTLRESIDNNETAGGNLLVTKRGKEIFYHEDGFSDREAGRRISRDTIFRLYSMTKPVTAAAVMILLERGKIDLYDPVSKYLNGFKNQMVDEGGNLVPAEREATLKDMLSMTSGLVYGGDSKAGRETEALFQEFGSKLLDGLPMTTLEVMNRLGMCTLAFQPGYAWEYGYSADVLGAVVEVVSGKRFGEFLQEEIFEPLNMQDTGFSIPKEKMSRLVKAYASDGKGGLEIYTGAYQADVHPAFESGGGGLLSTIDDYSRFAGMLINGGNSGNIQILRPKTVEYMTSATLSAAQQRTLWFDLDGYSYGNLLRIMTDYSRAGVVSSQGEYGWSGWMGTYFCNCPKDGLIYIFMMQKTDSGTTHLARKLQNIILSACCE